VIGVYEPMIVSGASGDYRTSLAAQPELFRTQDACFHEACYQLAVALAAEG
jgi:hypothetical protein